MKVQSPDVERDGAAAQVLPRAARTPAGQLLAEGAIGARAIAGALAESGLSGAPVEDVLAREGLVPESEVLTARAQSMGLAHLDRASDPPDPTVTGYLPVHVCLSHGVLPWKIEGDALVVGTCDPDRLAAALDHLPPDAPPRIVKALVSEVDIHAEIAMRYGAALARQAEQRLPAADSCRDLAQATWRSAALAAGLAAPCVAALALAPQVFFAAVVMLALASLAVSQLLKLSALVASAARPAAPDPRWLPKDLPMVSLLVPLFDEYDIAGALIARLGRLTYPKVRLEILLILEEGDAQTRAGLAEARLPPWMRAVEVPRGSVMTKPRALNYALNFTRGDIIGIYDAEDAPAPDQIERIVSRFAKAPPKTACLQGILDFYNPRANWLSRCFTIEYATWFRVMLPGLARLGLPVPLGGTSVFIRRSALEAAGGWDSHNVTEDADLGIRLARLGYRTELVATVTREEANNRLWPWIRQRSRWLKGYAVTWWVHSRRPLRLWRDLGTWRFLGLQALLLTTLLQFALAPVLWSFWLVLLGLPHPLDPLLTGNLLAVMVTLFLCAEGIGIVAAATALARGPYSRLLPWIPTLVFYFPLGSLAFYRGLWQAALRPFHWDKTRHGVSQPGDPEDDLPEQPR